MTTAAQLDEVRSKLSIETGLAEVITTRQNGRPLVALINAGIIAHPVTGDEAVAFVSGGSAARLKHLRRDPQITMAVRRGWNWSGIDGVAELAGPNDPHSAIAAEAVPQLLRQIFQAAGGTHDDYDEFDRAMAADERCAVIITPQRIYGNNPS